MPGYSCKACGATVEIYSGGARRYTCKHRGTVVASMSAVARGKGGVVPFGEKFERALNQIVRRIQGLA